MGIAGLVVLAFPAWLFGAKLAQQRAENIALARDWTIDGPPCPQISAAEFAAGRYRHLRGLQYENATFVRAVGHMECSPIAYDGGRGLGAYAVCQFTGPTALKVTTRRGDWFFRPGPGQPATVSAPHDEPRCVLASNFTLKALMGR